MSNRDLERAKSTFRSAEESEQRTAGQSPNSFISFLSRAGEAAVATALGKIIYDIWDDVLRPWIRKITNKR